MVQGPSRGPRRPLCHGLHGGETVRVQALEKMVTSEALGGVPILVLASKQDVETCLGIRDIQTAFRDCTSKIGRAGQPDPGLHGPHRQGAARERR